MSNLRLNCDAIDSIPQSIDWSEAMGGDGEGWRSYESVQCDGCGRWSVVSSLGESECRDLSPSVTLEEEGGIDREYVNDCSSSISHEGPMMNYWYPVKVANCEIAARAIEHLPLCVVEFEDGRTGLALTGGGMDLSWEVCEAFVALGYYPPLHFCDLPRMSDRGKSAKDRATIAACEESCRIAEGWAARKRERLAENFPA